MLKSKIKVETSGSGVRNNFELKWGKFPAGEVFLKSPEVRAGECCYITADLFCSDSIMALALFKNSLDRLKFHNVVLFLRYVPYGRQDRAFGNGGVNSSLSLKVFCDLINAMNFKAVRVYEPHSDVTSALLERVTVFHVHPSAVSYHAGEYSPYGRASFTADTVLLCPDRGAVKRVEKLQQELVESRGLVLPLIYASKVRDPETGEITGTRIDYDGVDLTGKRVFVFDDICDGGRTFEEIGKVFKKDHPNTPMTLFVVHGLFTKGKEALYNYYEDVLAYFDYSM